VNIGRVFVVAFAFAGALAAAAQSEIDIEKFTNGQNADVPPGPAVVVGSTVNWTYIVSNTGSRPLSNIVVTDDQGVVVTCPATTLDAGFSFTCTASGTAVSGQYVNVGTVTATQPDTSVVMDSDPSHYFGEAAPAITIEKSTNGFDADTPPGPSLPVGGTVDWTYEITNIGSDDLADIIVTDDQGVVVSCPATDLAPGASMTCTASGIAQAGQYANIGTVEATLPSEEGVVDSDPSHYFGQTLSLIKRTNGIESAGPPGPTLAPETTVTWTYEVANPGPAAVTALSVTDDQGVIVTCSQTTLAAGESVTCTGSGTAQPGQYMNVGTATATLPAGGTVSATDESFYFSNVIGIEKSTNGVDADTAPGPSVTAGDTVNWTYVVTNLGSETLTGVTVTDDQGETVTCPGTTLMPGESMVCTASDVAVAGQYANLGSVDATSPTLGTVSAADASHYFGQSVALDFGDAPDPTYLSLFASDGARHIIAGGIYLGACVDAEADALSNAAADGDDTTAGTETGTCATPGDDEDGITFTTPVRVGLTGTVDVAASAPCTLSAWIDFNRDGDWGEPDDDLFPGGTALVAGTNSLVFNVPAGASAGATFARFRCTTDGAVSFTGEASDGEVEDHPVDIVIPVPSVSATKDDALLIDGDSDGFAEPGDTLQYTIVITNSGTGDATAVVFNDTPDSNTSLVVGSVTTTSGTITTGNAGGDTSVSVDAGTVAALGGTVTITFQVLIDDPLALGVASVSNQGSVSGENFSTVQTDDPSTGAPSDPTVTPVVTAPIITVTKDDALQQDVDSDGNADPGDTIRYTIVIENSGNGNALSVSFDDTPDANTALVNGSVTTSLGTVTSGNTAGDTSVAVDVGTLPGYGGTATIVFDVTVDDPLALGVTTVSNQGTVSGGNFTTLQTDDPATGASSDPTVTPVTTTPIVTVTKTDALQQDVDGDGNADPGDTIRYTVVLENSGNGNALNVFFDDTPDPNTALVNGSVTTTLGTVTTGNTAGDTSVAVDVGTLPGYGGTATIVFDVQVDDPFTLGVASVSNQGSASGGNFTTVQTDDPATAAPTDATVTPVTTAPNVTASKTAALQGDADGDGIADPGDTIRYTIVIQNSGDGNALGVSFDDTPDPNTNLVNGSVTTTLGTVTSGNMAGDTTVTVDVGTLPGYGGTATIVFDVQVDDPLSPNVSQIVNSGTVSGSNFAPAATDDPSQPGGSDPTVFAAAGVAIPTLQTWALLAMLAILGVVALRRMAV
jgi:uncharacterized repeat protein (TIGR01451 family)